MTTRKPFLFLLLLLLIGSSGAHASSYSMASASLPASAEPPSSPEPARLESVGGDSSSRYMLGVDAAPAASSRSAESDDADGAAATNTAGSVGNRVGAPVSSTPSSRQRNGNRWQSLVPGAIK